MNDRYLITGASGFIGSHLVDHLLSKKVPARHISLLILPNSDLSGLPNAPFRIISGDIRDPQIVRTAVKQADYIYHLAAISGFAGITYNDFASVNVAGTQNLIDACKKQPLKKFVFFSTIAVYGLPAWVGDIVNWDETYPKKYSEVYGQSKAEAEQIIIKAHQSHGLPYTIIRPTSVYGPRDRGQLFGLYQAIYHRYFMKIGDGLNKLDLVYVKDLVAGAEKAAKHKSRASDYILGAITPTVFNEVIGAISRSVNQPLGSFCIPTWLALPASDIINRSCKLVGVHSPIFPSRVKVMTRTYYYNCQKSMREIGYKPETNFTNGAEITGKWYRQNNWL